MQTIRYEFLNHLRESFFSNSLSVEDNPTIFRLQMFATLSSRRV